MDIVEILNDCIVGRHMHAESQDLALSCGFRSRMHATSGRRPHAERHTDCLHKNTRVAQCCTLNNANMALPYLHANHT